MILADESDRSFSATYGKEWVKSRMKNMTPFTLRLHEKAGGCSSFILTSIQLEQCLPYVIEVSELLSIDFFIIRPTFRSYVDISLKGKKGGEEKPKPIRYHRRSLRDFGWITWPHTAKSVTLCKQFMFM